MKKSFLMLIVLILWTGLLPAHPPQNVQLDYDNKTQILEIRFEHKVKDPTDHFIYQSKIKVNKKEMIVQEITMQDSVTGGHLLYKLNHVKPGDQIEVRLPCNKGGVKSGKLKIE